MTFLRVLENGCEQEISIMKHNNIFVKNQYNLFKFYCYFYRCLIVKDKSIQINIGNQIINTKNSILLSLIDYKELLESFSFKKGTLLYEYILTIIQDKEFLSNDILLYELSDIAKDIVSSSKFALDYDLNDDIEKLILNSINFKLNISFDEITVVIKSLLQHYFEKFKDKNFIVFYDSSIMNYNFDSHENCYCFDINNVKDFEDYNIICSKELKEFNIKIIMDKIESIWPVEFDGKIVKTFIKDYYYQTKYSKNILCMCETQLITYSILKKINDEDITINSTNFIIRDNVKQFLEHL